MPKDLQKAAQGFGVKIPSLPDGGGLSDVLKKIPGLPGAAPSAPKEPSDNGKKSSAPDPGKVLRNLFGR